MTNIQKKSIKVLKVLILVSILFHLYNLFDFSITYYDTIRNTNKVKNDIGYSKQEYIELDNKIDYLQALMFEYMQRYHIQNKERQLLTDMAKKKIYSITSYKNEFHTVFLFPQISYFQDSMQNKFDTKLNFPYNLVMQYDSICKFEMENKIIGLRSVTYSEDITIIRTIYE